MRENELFDSDIENVTLSILNAGFALVAEPEEIKYNPKAIVDAQFSMPFGAAMAVLYGKATLDQYTQQNLRSPAVKKMMRKITCIKDPEIEKDFPKKWAAVAKIKTTTGQQYAANIDYPKGDPENPFSWEELISKFQNLISPVYSEARQIQIIEKIRSLEQIRDVSELSKLLAKD
jgi:2-methylcitrate dehydratase PrpD